MGRRGCCFAFRAGYHFGYPPSHDAPGWQTMNDIDSGIGRRVLALRDLAGLTQQQLADAVGVTQAYVSMIENGRSAVTRRSTLYALADALGVPHTELTGQPLPASRPEDLLTYGAVAGIRAGLDYPDQPVTPRPRRELAALTRKVLVARMACDYGTLGAALPALLAETRAAYEQGNRWAGTLLVHAHVAGALAVKPAGWTDLAGRLAWTGQQIANELGDDPLVGAATFAVAQCAMGEGRPARSAGIATAVASELSTGGGADVQAWTGMLHLQAGLASAALGDARAVDEHFGRALDLAASIDGDPILMEFTPDNCRTWRLAAALENGDAGRAPELASRVDPTKLRTRDRLARYWADTGRAWYAAEQPGRAVTAFQRAYQVAPARIRTSPTVREIAGQIRRDAGSRPGSELVALTGALGIGPRNT